MRFLITGGCGFIGSNFIRYLLEKCDDAEVINVDALKTGSNPRNLEGIRERYEFVHGDIANFSLISELVSKSDVIVNFAAETHVDRSISNPEAFLHSNVLGVFTILEAIRKKKRDVRFIQISTDEVYGEAIDRSFREDDRPKPSSPYSATKASGDMLVLSYVRTYGIDAIITRCTNNYGPYQFPEKLIPKTIIRARMGLKVPVYGSGKSVRDWIYVFDHCEALMIAIERGEKGEIYNISSGEEKTVLEVVEAVLRLMGKDGMVEFVEDRPGHDFRYSLDSSKIRSLGWRPKISFEEGIRKTVEWYLKNEWWWKPLVDDKVLHPTPWKLEWP